MPILKQDPEGGFHFQGLARFESLEPIGEPGNMAIVLRFDDGYAMRLHLPARDLDALLAALSRWQIERLSAEASASTKH